MAGEDDTLASRFLCVDVDSSHEDWVGAVQDDQKCEADDVAAPVAEFRWICGRDEGISIGGSLIGQQISVVENKE